MELRIDVILKQNITLVYDSFELDTVDRNALRNLVDSSSGPTVMDTPEMIVVVFPEWPVIVQVGDRRWRVTYQRQDDSLGSIPLWEIAAAGNRILRSGAAAELVAYGFNYDLVCALENGEASPALLDLFFSEGQAGSFEEAASAEIMSVIPRIKFRRGTTVYDLVLEPLQGGRMKVHLNAHFETPDITMPGADELAESFNDQYGYLRSLLSGLFEGEEG